MRSRSRSVTYRGSRRRVRTVRLRDNWPVEMTVLVAIVLVALGFVLYRAFKGSQLLRKDLRCANSR
jgi:hypothetical protein